MLASRPDTPGFAPTIQQIPNAKPKICLFVVLCIYLNSNFQLETIIANVTKEEAAIESHVAREPPAPLQ